MTIKDPVIQPACMYAGDFRTGIEGGKRVQELVSTAGLPKTILLLPVWMWGMPWQVKI